VGAPCPPIYSSAMSGGRFRILVVGAVVGVVCALPATAEAATLTVTSTADAGPGSLRADIAAAAPGDTVLLPASAAPYTVSSGEIAITDAITIEGAGAASSIVDADGMSRVFHITTGVPSTGTVSFEDMTITGGAAGAPGGGGVLDSSGNLTLTDVTVGANTATVISNSPGLGGGGILQDGNKLTLTDSTVTGNTANITGTGEMDGGGGIHNQGSTLTLTASTVDHDAANVSSKSSSGGGGVLDAASDSDPVYLNSTIADNSTDAPSSGTNGGGGVFTDNVEHWYATNVTIAGNTSSAARGGGVFWDGGGELYAKSSIIAENKAGTGEADCASTSSPFETLGHNLTDITGECRFTESTDVTTATPGLGPLAANGGPTQTMALLPGSPAIDAIPIAECTDQSTPTPQPVTTDQRGVPRPQPAGGNCDIGAFEVGDADLSLAASANPAVVDVGQRSTITFTVTDPGPAPATHAALSVTLPAGLAFVSVSSTQGSCAAGGPGVTCTLGVVETGSAVRVAIVVQAGVLGSLSASGTIGATEPDPTPADETATVTLDSVLAPVAAPPTAPSITHATESSTRWRRGSRLAAFTRRSKKPPVGTSFSFTLNEAASVTFAFTERVGGRKVGDRCVAQTGKNRRKTACRRTITRGTLHFSAPAGTSKLSFQGRISASKRLEPGRYTLVITATNAAGQRSEPQTLSFTIVAQ
jgi:uncharacterized repeat protein (TIGR01451 family)